jgi:hypothetical protein
VAVAPGDRDECSTSSHRYCWIGAYAQGTAVGIAVSGAAATAFRRSDFDAFLFASIGEDSDANRMQLSVLSALARQDMDPWEEAARLACLPSEIATQELTSLIAAIPDGRAGGLSAGTIAVRLIALLPRGVRAGTDAPGLPHGVATAPGWWPVSHPLMYVTLIVCMVVFQWFIASHLRAPELAQKATPLACKPVPPMPARNPSP